MLHRRFACETDTAQLTLCVPEDTLFFGGYFSLHLPSLSQECRGHVHKPHLVAY